MDAAGNVCDQEHKFGVDLTRAEALSRTRRIISAIIDLPPEAIGLTDRLRQDLGADSLDVAEIILALSKEFGRTATAIPNDCDTRHCCRRIQDLACCFAGAANLSEN